MYFVSGIAKEGHVMVNLNVTHLEFTPITKIELPPLPSISLPFAI
jgi:hypothetical protein